MEVGRAISSALLQPNRLQRSFKQAAPEQGAASVQTGAAGLGNLCEEAGAARPPQQSERQWRTRPVGLCPTIGQLALILTSWATGSTPTAQRDHGGDPPAHEVVAAASTATGGAGIMWAMLLHGLPARREGGGL